MLQHLSQSQAVRQFALYAEFLRIYVIAVDLSSLRPPTLIVDVLSADRVAFPHTLPL